MANKLRYFHQAPTKQSVAESQVRDTTGVSLTTKIQNIESVAEQIQQEVNTKVNKVPGKVFSSNDYTNVDKTKLSNIEVGAEANVQADWDVSDSSSDSYIKNKPTFIESGEQTTTSSADGGQNIYTFTYSDGTSSQFVVKNGSKGSTGPQGEKGDKGDKGNTGATPTIVAAAGSNINKVGTPSVTASTSGTTTTFTFNYLKGAKGDAGSSGSGGSEYVVDYNDSSHNIYVGWRSSALSSIGALAAYDSNGNHIKDATTSAVATWLGCAMCSGGNEFTGTQFYHNGAKIQMSASTSTYTISLSPGSIGNAQITCSGDVGAYTFTTLSDANQKENIQEISPDTIDKIKNISLKQFNYIGLDKQRYGVIAQDVAECGLGCLTSQSEDGMLRVNYTDLLILKIAQLEKEISELKEMINA